MKPAAFLFLAFTLSVAAPSSAAPGDPAAHTFSMQVLPIFGTDAATGYGWTEVVARIDNSGVEAEKGTLELVSETGAEHEVFTTRTSFNVPGGRSASVRLPTHGFAPRSSTLTATAWSSTGVKLASTPVVANVSFAPLLVDVDDPSRLSVALRNAAVPTTWNPAAYAGSTSLTSLTVGAPSFDPTTGDPILPEHAAGYAPATVVVIHSDALARLESVALGALVDWVIEGGTLAVIPSRPEDLRGPTLTAMIGGVAAPGQAPAALLSLLSSPPSSALSSNPFLVPPFPTATPPPGSPPQPRGKTSQLVGPSPAVRAKLVGYAGGNLRPSDFGASASYGTGEVHLLAFDPTTPPTIDDPWVLARMVALAAHAWDRHSINALRAGTLVENASQLNDVRRSLDPNENFRLALGLAAILLVGYSVLSGPVLFARATKTGKPLSPLKWAPVYSAVTFASVVIIGTAGKGWRGRARHLSFIEAGAGVSRANIRRFRGFFTSEARSLSVSTTDASSVIDVTEEDAASPRRLTLSRGGASLDNIAALPWETVVVAEDGAVETKGGVSVLPGAGTTLDVVNRTGSVLRDVIVHVPAAGVTVYFAEIKDGVRVSSGAGQILTSAPHRTFVAGSVAVHPLDAATLGAPLPSAAATRLAATWGPLEAAAGNEIDWWPDDAPVVLAELVGFDTTTRDSGLVVETTRTLLRVVGQGGAP